MENEDFADVHFKKIFDDEMRFLQRRRENNPNLKIEDLQGQLESLYVSQGQDWDGRGFVADAEMDAQISAYEAFIESWRNEKK